MASAEPPAAGAGVCADRWIGVSAATRPRRSVRINPADRLPPSDLQSPQVQEARIHTSTRKAGREDSPARARPDAAKTETSSAGAAQLFPPNTKGRPWGRPAHLIRPDPL